MAMLFWQIGGRINVHVLEHKRARYGEQIVVTLSRQLVAAHGNNFEEKNLRRMMQLGITGILQQSGAKLSYESKKEVRQKRRLDKIPLLIW